MKRPALALLALSTAAYCADSGFDHLVKAVETHYGTRRMHIPLMGLANFVVKVARPAGTSGFKMAIFENLNAEGGDWAELDRFMLGAANGGLHPMVRVHDRHSGESTYIYAGEVGKSTRMLIATFEPKEAVIIEVKVNMETFMKMMEMPERASHVVGVTDER